MKMKLKHSEEISCNLFTEPSPENFIRERNVFNSSAAALRGLFQESIFTVNLIHCMCYEVAV
jgi:hypothetical protein